MAKYKYTQKKKPATPTSTTAEKIKTGGIMALMQLSAVAITGVIVLIAMNIRPIWHGLNIAIMDYASALPTASLFITSPVGIVAQVLLLFWH